MSDIKMTKLVEIDTKLHNAEMFLDPRYAQDHHHYAAQLISAARKELHEIMGFDYEKFVANTKTQ